MLRIKVRNASATVRERRLVALSVDDREQDMHELLQALRTEPDRNRAASTPSISSSSARTG